MSRVDIETVAQWTVYVILTTFFVGLLAFAAVAAHDSIVNDRSRDACGEAGGKVDYYDSAHAKLWRCSQPAERAP